MKDFLSLRPMNQRLEERVRAHIALCVIATVMEAVVGNDLVAADLRDPDLPEQMTPRRALHELDKIRLHKLNAGRDIEIIDRPNTLQRAILEALQIDAESWARPISPEQGRCRARRGNNGASCLVYLG